MQQLCDACGRKCTWPPHCGRRSATAPPPTEINATSARVLLLLVVPGHLAFFSVVSLLESQSVPSDRTFMLLYLLAGLVQVRTATAPRPGRGLVQVRMATAPRPGRGPWTSRM